MTAGGGATDFGLGMVKEGDRVYVRPSGDLDLYTVPRLRSRIDELLAEGWRDIVVDLSRLDFVDSQGLGLFVTLKKLVGAAEGDFRLASPSPAVARVLDIAGLTRVLEVIDLGSEEG